MNYTFKIDKSSMVTARTTANISFKKSIEICSKINRKKYKTAKKFVNDLIDEKTSINGRYHTKAAKEILGLLNSVEKNAVARDFDPENMMLYASAQQGPSLMRGRRKRDFGLKIKICHIQAVLKTMEEKKTEEKIKKAVKEKVIEKLNEAKPKEESKEGVKE